MDDEKLIILVQANECLFNKYCPDYKMPEKKRNIWSQISAEMQYPEEICQRRWSCLRDRYAKAKRQENLPSGSGAKPVSQWPLMQTMDFISPHVVPRPMRSSYNICEENSQSSSQSPLSVLTPLSASSVSVFPSLVEMSQDLEFSPILPSPTTPSLPKRKRRVENQDNSFSEALESLKKLCESRVGKPKEDDALTGFGKMIIATIRTMSETKQILAMQRVTSLVMEIKLEGDI